MNKILIFLVFALFACGNNNQKSAIIPVQEQQKTANPDNVLLKTLVIEFDSINTLVRDNQIDKLQALKELQRIVPELKAIYNHLQSGTIKQDKWIFPVEGYSSKNIGGTHGEGYIPGGYDYFAGNKHTGHPAQDVFIYDKNQDCKDDRTGKYVNVLSVCNGIVVALEKEWDSESSLRGGKYIWIYAPAENALYYYAHNNDVFVDVGQIVNAGNIIATIGRTGLNAFKKRSPTHLHFMKLVLDKEFYPKPVNTYQELLNAKKQ
jgi:hypothetical protein